MAEDHPIILYHPVSSCIILFDAQCVLCSANAQFVLRHDKARRFRLAAMQGAMGTDLFRRHGSDPDDPDTIIVLQGEKALRDSDAMLAIYAGLGWPWRLAGLLRLLPKALRDPPYRWIARNRYNCSADVRRAGYRHQTWRIFPYWWHGRR